MIRYYYSELNSNFFAFVWNFSTTIENGDRGFQYREIRALLYFYYYLQPSWKRKETTKQKGPVLFVCFDGLNFNIFKVVLLDNDKKKGCRVWDHCVVSNSNSPACLVVYKLDYSSFL